METTARTCVSCATELLPESIYCHRCGRRAGSNADSVTSGEAGVPDAAPAVRLHGLYDENRREELALALIPILAGISRTIDMSNVEHIDLAALVSVLPLLQAHVDALATPVAVIGMNDDVHHALTRAGIAGFFVRS